MSDMSLDERGILIDIFLILPWKHWVLIRNPLPRNLMSAQNMSNEYPQHVSMEK